MTVVAPVPFWLLLLQACHQGRHAGKVLMEQLELACVRGFYRVVSHHALSLHHSLCFLVCSRKDSRLLDGDDVGQVIKAAAADATCSTG